MLRSHQASAKIMAEALRNGDSTKFHLLSVTPGGGKSGIPPIFAEQLIPEVVDKILWVVPRKSLQSQGEREFLSPIWETEHRVRIAGNSSMDPTRGLSGYITTYQGIAARPFIHEQEFKSTRYALFLDESHHVSEDDVEESKWAEALKPLVEMAKVVVFMSGTLHRADGKRIAFMPYHQAFIKTPDDWKRIDYTRSMAIKERAILPVDFFLYDAFSSWEDKKGNIKKSTTLKVSKNAGDALFSALSTEFAEHILDVTVNHWLEYKNTVLPAAKLLVVAPNIELAEKYNEYLVRFGIRSLIATSKDDKEAAVNINRFKGIKKPEIDVLSTVGMAYEGLSVKPATHIACLTHIRSIPWLEQLFARVNRLYPGKEKGFIFAPMDERMEEAIRSIEREQLLALSQRDEKEKKEGGEKEEREVIKINPLSSGAIGIDVDLQIEEVHTELPASEEEKVLKKEIEDHINVYVRGKRYGRRHVNRAIKEVFGKSRTEMSTVELKDVLSYLKNVYVI